MDSLFYLNNSTDNSTLETVSSNTYSRSLIFAESYWGAIFARGKEYGTYVREQDKHYVPVNVSGKTKTFYKSATATVEIPADGQTTASNTYIKGVTTDNANHILSVDTGTQNFKHGAAGSGTADEFEFGNLTIPGADNSITAYYFSGISKDANGHVTGKNKKTHTISHGTAGTGTADLVSHNDVTIPADGTTANLTYYAGVSKDANGHVTGKNSGTLKLNHGDIHSAAISNIGQSSDDSAWEHGESIKIPYLTVSKQGHVTSLTEHTITQKFVTNDGGEAKKIVACSASEYDNLTKDNNTIYFIV